MKDHKRLTNEELNEFLSRVFIQLEPELAQQMMSVANELLQYRDKIEQGLMIELPCKVGDAVYRAVNDKRRKYADECKVVGIFIGTQPVYSEIYLVKYTNGTFVYSVAVPLSEVGKTIFLTEAEAEAKLRELKGDRE